MKIVANKHIIGVCLTMLSSGLCFAGDHIQYDDSWTGLHGGVFIGEAWVHNKASTDAGTLKTLSYFTSVDNINSVNANGSGNINNNGFIGGARLMQNWVANNFLYGVEVQFSSMPSEQKKTVTAYTYPTFPATYNMSVATDIKWLGSAQGRIGYLLPSWKGLLYVSGGVGLSRIQTSNSFIDTAGSVGVANSSHSDTKGGWVAAVGAEKLITNKLSIFGEYSYVDLGSVSTSGEVICSVNVCAAGTSSPFKTSFDVTTSMFNVGINYKLV